MIYENFQKGIDFHFEIHENNIKFHLKVIETMFSLQFKSEEKLGSHKIFHGF